MSPFWQKFLVSQCYLFAAFTTVISALVKHDGSALTLESAGAWLLLYAGSVLQFPAVPKGAAKTGVPLLLSGALLCLSTGLCRLFDISAVTTPLILLFLCLALPVLGFGVACLIGRSRRGRLGA